MRRQRTRCAARRRWDESRALLLMCRRGRFYQISGPRPFLVEPLLRSLADLFGGDGADAIRPASDVVDAQAGGERAAIPARQRRLVVLGVDGFGDQLGLDAFEIFGANPVLSDIRNYIVDHLLDLREFDAGSRRGRDRELRRIERGALISGAGGDRERLFDHEPAIEEGMAGPPPHWPT